MIRNFARIVDTPIGRFAINIQDFYVGRSILFYGEHSGLEQRLFAKLVKPSNIVIDAGSNIGFHSVCFARLITDAGVVLAFEPQEHVFQALCANTFLNSLINIKPYRVALGAKAGTIGVPYLDPRVLNNFGGCKLGGDAGHVPVITIDSLDLPRCDFVKIDVEGAELEVLKGARETIRKFHPILYLETQAPNEDGSTIFHLRDRLRDHGYTHLLMHLPPLFNERNPNGVMENFLGDDVVSINLLATMEPPPDDKFLVPLPDYLAAFEREASPPPTQSEAPIPLEPAGDTIK